MASTSSQQSIGSSSQERKGWRDEINGNLIRYSNKTCRCYKRAALKVSESDDNPNKLYYCCMDSKHGCGYFKFWIPSPNDFNRGAIFDGIRTCQENYELLMGMQKDMKEMKSIMQKAQQNRVKCSAVNVILFLNLVFFICAIVVSIIGVVIAAK